MSHRARVVSELIPRDWNAHPAIRAMDVESKKQRAAITTARDPKMSLRHQHHLIKRLDSALSSLTDAETGSTGVSRRHGRSATRWGPLCAARLLTTPTARGVFRATPSSSPCRPDTLCIPRTELRKEPIEASFPLHSDGIGARPSRRTTLRIVRPA